MTRRSFFQRLLAVAAGTAVAVKVLSLRACAHHWLYHINLMAFECQVCGRVETDLSRAEAHFAFHGKARYVMGSTDRHGNRYEWYADPDPVRASQFIGTWTLEKARGEHRALYGYRT